MAWTVYDKTGETARCEVKSVEYNGTWMGECYVTATVESDVPIAFAVFDYLEYRGERFELEMVPTVKKTSSRKYTYDLRFVSLKYELERCQMRDLVPDDNGVVYPTPLTIEFTGTVKYLAERIQACMDALYGEGVWSITVAEGVESEEKNISLSNTNCWNALSLVNTEYGLNFYVSGRTVTIGDEQPVIDHVFEYGKNKGLYEIERVADTDTGVVTKLRAYGSTRNLDASYPKKPDWPESVLPATYVLSPLRLMLPSFKLDGKTDYVLADDELVSQYGIREASITYDDIYPSITGMKNSAGQAIDEIRGVTPVTDNDASTFKVTLYDLGFDLEDNVTTEQAQMSIKTGTLQGYTFNIESIDPIPGGGYTLTLERNTLSDSDTGNFTVPNTNLNAKAGDKFVLLNILMPKEYIEAAEERLQERAEEYLAQYGKTNYTYNIGVDEIFMGRNPLLLADLKEGKKLTLKDTAMGMESHNITIQNVAIKEGESLVPEVVITLNDNPSAGTLERIQGQVDSIESTVANNFSSQSELSQQYRRKLDKVVWDSVFVRHFDDPSDPNKITSLECLVGLYTNSFLSALGLDDSTTGGGGGGGASTLGQLNNVGSWADEVPTADRVLVQLAGATHWSSKPLSELVGLDTEALADYLAENKYATQSWVTGQGYATQSWVTGKGYLTSVSLATISDLHSSWDELLGAVPSVYVTRWPTFAEVTDKPKTLAGYGITDAYTKAETDTKLSGKLDQSAFDELFEKVELSDGTYAIHAKLGLYTDGFLSALGLDTETSGGGGGGTSYDRLDAWADYTAEKAGWVLSAALGEDLNTRLASLESGAGKVSLAGITDLHSTWDALLKAGKNFDLVVLPGQGHQYRGEPSNFFQRKVWFHFAKHLLGDYASEKFTEIDEYMRIK